MALAYYATARIYINNVLAFDPGDLVPDSTVTAQGYVALGLVTQQTVPDPAPSSSWDAPYELVAHASATFLSKALNGANFALGVIPTDTALYPGTTTDGFGVLIQALDGSLQHYYSQAAGDGVAPGLIRRIKSTDGGVNFTAPVTIVDDGGLGFAHTAVSGGITPNGRIILFYPDYNATAGTTTALRVIYSDDHGATFSSPVTLGQNSRAFAIPFGRMQVLDGGTLMLSGYTSTAALNTGTPFEVLVWFSIDNGLTWSAPTTVASSNTENFSETSFLYLGGKQIVGLIRMTNVGYLRQVKSVDNGVTWTQQGNATTLGTFTGAGAPPDLVLLRDTSGLPKVVVYYRPTASILSAVGDPATLIASGTSGWDATSIKTVSTVANRSYPTFVHPNGQNYGVGFGMKNISATVNYNILLSASPLPSLTSFAPKASLNTKFFRLRRASTDLTINGTTYVALAGFTGTIAASVGDIVEVGLTGQWGPEATDGYLDAFSVVSGAFVNAWGSGDAYSAGSGGAVEAWRGFSGRQMPVGGSTIKQIQAGDIDPADGLVHIALSARTGTATNKTLYADSADQVTFWAINHG